MHVEELFRIIIIYMGEYIFNSCNRTVYFDSSLALIKA